MTDYPDLPPGRHLPDQQRIELGNELRRQYDNGASIRQICVRTGYSIGRVRRLLIGAGVEFRARGGAHYPGTVPL